MTHGLLLNQEVILTDAGDEKGRRGETSKRLLEKGMEGFGTCTEVGLYEICVEDAFLGINAGNRFLSVRLNEAGRHA